MLVKAVSHRPNSAPRSDGKDHACPMAGPTSPISAHPLHGALVWEFTKLAVPLDARREGLAPGTPSAGERMGNLTEQARGRPSVASGGPVPTRRPTRPTTGSGAWAQRRGLPTSELVALATGTRYRRGARQAREWRGGRPDRRAAPHGRTSRGATARRRGHGADRRGALRSGEEALWPRTARLTEEAATLRGGACGDEQEARTRREQRRGELYEDTGAAATAHVCAGSGADGAGRGWSGGAPPYSCHDLVVSTTAEWRRWASRPGSLALRDALRRARKSMHSVHWGATDLPQHFDTEVIL